jgi:hypothetical protein
LAPASNLSAKTDDGRLARGRRRARELALKNESGRQLEEAALLRDLGREPSHAERILVEQLSALIIRGRRLRQAGRSTESEMVARLVIRGVARLGVRQGTAKHQPYDFAAAARRAAEAAAAASAPAESNALTTGHSAEPGEGS